MVHANHKLVPFVSPNQAAAMKVRASKELNVRLIGNTGAREVPQTTMASIAQWPLPSKTLILVFIGGDITTLVHYMNAVTARESCPETKADGGCCISPARPLGAH